MGQKLKHVFEFEEEPTNALHAVVEADPVGDMAHPEDIGVEMRETRHKSCRGMPVMLRL